MDSQTDITELIAWLETDEAASREARAFRLRHLLEAIQPPREGIFFKGKLLFILSMKYVLPTFTACISQQCYCL